MATSARARVKRQVRGFVLVWTLVTIVMGACTFVAIFAAYGQLPLAAVNSARSNAALPLATQPGAQQAVIVLTNTPFPTRALAAVTPTRAATEESAQALAAGAEETEAPSATPEPTLLPVDVDRFEVGIQVQVSHDLMDMWMDVASDQLGVEWVKYQVRWEDVESEQGEYNWS